MGNDKPIKRQPKRMTFFQQMNFRAGLFGFPFCVVEYYLKRTPIFLLGGGFFAALFFTGLHEWWKLGRPSIWGEPRPNKPKDYEDL